MGKINFPKGKQHIHTNPTILQNKPGKGGTCFSTFFFFCFFSFFLWAFDVFSDFSEALRVFRWVFDDLSDSPGFFLLFFFQCQTLSRLRLTLFPVDVKDITKESRWPLCFAGAM